jgi:hypothetical protein
MEKIRVEKKTKVCRPEREETSADEMLRPVRPTGEASRQLLRQLGDLLRELDGLLGEISREHVR